MKILMVAIPNHHFFQWVNQLKGSGYEVIWFDVSDGGSVVDRISWVKQIKGWKLKCDFPFRHAIKSNFPKGYKIIQQYNERKIAAVFKKIIQDFQPDQVHCFEMRLAGLPILGEMLKFHSIPLLYSSWGSDLFYYSELGVSKEDVAHFLNRVNYLITDCQRDYAIAIANGYENQFLGVYPGNGGITIGEAKIEATHERDILLIKGYDDGVGKASVVLEALKQLPLSLIQSYTIVIYSAENHVVETVQNDIFYKGLKVQMLKRGVFISNKKLLEIMGKSILHVGNSISDGMPNALLEAMAMGAFPIQSNPGNVTEEVIVNGKNGYLINDPLDPKEIAVLIEQAIKDSDLREAAMAYNVDFIDTNYNRRFLNKKIINLYKGIAS
jgi:glycosyltransferase involved in cell wall biosynthesis